MPATVGVYYRDDEMDELKEFDVVEERNQHGRGYSRSEAVRDSMEMHQMILETLEDLEWAEDMTKEKRESVVKQALLEFGQSAEE